MDRPRLWPAALVLALLGAALARIWLFGDRVRQYQVMPTIAACVLAALLLVVWLAFFSRFPRRVRMGALAAALVAVVSAVSLLRIRGVTGDLVPILTPRFATPATPPPAFVVVPETALPERVDPVRAAPPGEPATHAPAARPARAARRPGDFPQFLGPSRDGTVTGVRLARDWTTRAPRKLWRQAIGEGWSGFAVVGDVAVTQEQRGAEERVVAYDLLTGRALWSHRDSARYETVIAGIGPRSTPTIADGRVFTMGATGILNALDLATGRGLWSRNVIEENGGRLGEWGKSCAPLVHGAAVIVSAGGSDGRSLVAYDAATGRPLWSGGKDRDSYSSPRLADLAGRPQIVVLNGASVAGHDPETGAVLWVAPWPAEQPNVTPPLPLDGGRLLVSTGYGVGAKLFRLDPGPDGALEARVVWESPRLKSKFANLVVHDGWVYGLDDGVLTCLDPATGERKWKGGRYGHGQLLLVGDVLLVQTEEGEVVLLDPSPDGPRELARYAVLDGKTWNPPALAGTLLAVRNDREAAVYELPALD
jgi:outer membrane protein assembly factor BamB